MKASLSASSILPSPGAPAVSAVDRAHVRVARPGGDPLGEDLLDALEVRASEADVEGARVLLQVAPPLGAGDGHDVVALGEHPGEGELRRPAALLRRHLLDVADEVEV